MSKTVLNNIHYVYKETFKNYPRIKWFLLINFITELLVPFLAIVITTIVVYILTNNTNVEAYILIIIGVTVLTYILESLRYWSFLRYSFENTFTRNSTFWNRLSKHQITTDYINVESMDKRKIISKAFEAIKSNYYGIEMLLKQTPLILINIVGLIIYGVLITLYVPVVLVILVLMTIINFILTKRANIYLANKKNELNDEFLEQYYLTKDSTNPNYGKDIRLYNLGNWFDKLFVNLTKNRRRVTSKIEKRFLTANFSNTLFLFIRDAVGYGIVIGLVINNRIDLTTFTFLTGIITGFSLWLNGFTEASNQLRACNISVDKYRECIETEDRLRNNQGLSVSDLKLPITVEFKNVTFSYPKSKKPVIENLNFKIISGENLALVGNNGAGKTTVIKLLCGLYKPDEGSIEFNGINVSEFSTEDYMSLISVVFQDSEPLSLTIEDNISCVKNSDVDKAKLDYALENSGLKDKVMSLENKEKTYITQTFDESGIRLSGGEIQKLMLARSLYKGTSLLVLDEPTASLDPISEEKMYLKYEEYTEDSTSIFISHRLASTKFCDRIIFLDDGKIVEEGTHKELMKLNKLYREVFDIQAQYYMEGEENES
ncbi:ABC transporter ATP-binding protein [Mycoplasmatota bacterium]|nr:ABC transporter ATP-binding protein [Mycoplasmatota bacterium]